MESFDYSVFAAFPVQMFLIGLATGLAERITRAISQTR